MPFILLFRIKGLYVQYCFTFRFSLRALQSPSSDAEPADIFDVTWRLGLNATDVSSNSSMMVMYVPKQYRILMSCFRILHSQAPDKKIKIIRYMYVSNISCQYVYANKSHSRSCHKGFLVFDNEQHISRNCQFKTRPVIPILRRADIKVFWIVNCTQLLGLTYFIVFDPYP